MQISMYTSLVFALCAFSNIRSSSAVRPRPWKYICDEYDRCIKTEAYLDQKGRDNEGQEGQTMSFSQCKLTCDPYATLWPRPKTFDNGGNRLAEIDPVRIAFSHTPQHQWLKNTLESQIKWLKKKQPGSSARSAAAAHGVSIAVDMPADALPASGADPVPRRQTDESYSVRASISADAQTVDVQISAANYFGARHGLDTLFQLMEFDEIGSAFVMLSNFTIEDAPTFDHRGAMLDTSRNFFSVPVIKAMLEGMAHTKLNVFHWHLSDTHSFPIEMSSPELAEMTAYGAYDQDSVYTKQEIRDLVQFAHERGIRIVPELDQPAHVGAGWNVPGWDNLTVCVDQEPWYVYCVEPPCGQLNPVNDEVYDKLKLIYSELYSLFEFDTFHIGGDEISIHCWNSSAIVYERMEAMGMGRTKEDFIYVWEEFQQKSLGKLKQTFDDLSALESNTDLQVHLWTNTLTEAENIAHLSNKDYVIQIWTDLEDMSDPQVSTLANKDFKMIFSNVDSTYLDCGFGAWVGEGNNWCSPYKGWQKMYGNDIYEVMSARGIEADKFPLVLGGEVALWTEQTDDATVMGRMFPRASSYGERLWSNPSTKWYAAEQRMLQHRQRLIDRGVWADRLQPEWCRRNGGQCYGPEDNPKSEPEPEPKTETEDNGNKAAGTLGLCGLALAAALALVEMLR